VRTISAEFVFIRIFIHGNGLSTPSAYDAFQTETAKRTLVFFGNVGLSVAFRANSRSAIHGKCFFKYVLGIQGRPTGIAPEFNRFLIFAIGIELHNEGRST